MYAKYMVRQKISSTGWAAITALLGLIIIGTVSFRALENWTWIQSFYFTIVTLTTVGYGDLHPTSDESRLFASFFILLGVGVAVSAIGIIGSGYIKRVVERRTKD